MSPRGDVEYYAVVRKKDLGASLALRFQWREDPGRVRCVNMPKVPVEGRSWATLRSASEAESARALLGLILVLGSKHLTCPMIKRLTRLIGWRVRCPMQSYGSCEVALLSARHC